MELHSQQINVPLVSVLMTTYNREKYLGQAIESVLASTFQDFELIIVDDGSKDKTVEIARQYSLKNQRVKLYINEKNLGDYPNRNQAASYAKGKYLKYVDADDLIYPWGLEILVHCMEKFPEADWGLCSLGQDRDAPFPILLRPAEAYRYHYLGPGLFHKAPLSSIIKRTAFEKHGGFTPSRMVGDFDMWHRLAQISPVVLMPQGLVWYRQHDEQEMNHHLDFIMTYQKVQLQYLLSPQCPLTKEEVDIIFKNISKAKFKYLVKSLIRLNFRHAWVNFKSLIYTLK